MRKKNKKTLDKNSRTSIISQHNTTQHNTTQHNTTQHNTTQHKNLTLCFRHFEEEHLGKDVFLVPYYLGKLLSCDVSIVYPRTRTNKNMPESVRGVKLIALKSKIGAEGFLPEASEIMHSKSLRKEFVRYIKARANEIDFLMLFHAAALDTQLMGITYKRRNPSGKLYIKLDCDAADLKREIPKYNSLRRFVRKKFIFVLLREILGKKFAKHADRISCETSRAFELLKSIPPHSGYPFKWGDKLRLMPNGFDEEFLQSLGFRVKNFSEKENLMITVGRLGTEQKNTQMFLRALETIDLCGWQVLLIGPIEETFRKTVDAFFSRNPEKRANVIFTGPIYEKKELWEYYNRAKVFVLTSRCGSYELVLNEAKRFRNYLVSTDVGAARDLIEDGKFGVTINSEDDAALANVLSKITHGEIGTDVYADFDPASLSWESMVEKLDLET